MPADQSVGPLISQAPIHHYTRQLFKIYKMSMTIQAFQDIQVKYVIRMHLD